MLQRLLDLISRWELPIEALAVCRQLQRESCWTAVELSRSLGLPLDEASKFLGEYVEVTKH